MDAISTQHFDRNFTVKLKQASKALSVTLQRCVYYNLEITRQQNNLIGPCFR